MQRRARLSLPGIPWREIKGVRPLLLLFMMVFVSINETGGYSLIYDGVIRRNR